MKNKNKILKSLDNMPREELQQIVFNLLDNMTVKLNLISEIIEVFKAEIGRMGFTNAKIKKKVDDLIRQLK